MLKLYELLAKVGTNPQLRAWAMKQLIKLRHLKPRYKGSFSHKMDKDRVKDIIDPGWLTKRVNVEKAYSLKNKVLNITKAKDKLRHIRNKIQEDKDKFYGVTGQVEKLKTVKPGEKVIVPIGSKKPPFILTKTPKPKGPAEIIQFPKKPPGKADGGRIAKALPTRSRDI